jgi:hypothetical protein
VVELPGSNAARARPYFDGGLALTDEQHLTFSPKSLGEAVFEEGAISQSISGQPAVGYD